MENIYFPFGKLGHKEIGEFINDELGRLVKLRNDAGELPPVEENKDYELYEMYASKYNRLKELRMQLLGY